MPFLRVQQTFCHLCLGRKIITSEKIEFHHVAQQEKNMSSKYRDEQKKITFRFCILFVMQFEEESYVYVFCSVYGIHTEHGTRNNSESTEKVKRLGIMVLFLNASQVYLMTLFYLLNQSRIHIERSITHNTLT